MPSSFFILLRYFLRIDSVMLRINDTRIYHEFGKNYLLREFTSREAKVQDIRVSIQHDGILFIKFQMKILTLSSRVYLFNTLKVYCIRISYAIIRNLQLIIKVK